MYDPSVVKGRRKKNVVAIPSTNTVFADRQLYKRSAVLYNKINKELDIYCKTNRECKAAILNWLKTKSYNEIEALFVDG